ncbi:gem-associated protein 8 [Pteropus alecto]|uniref:gem-associated protein 8 n=1 Tax=Pteropus alecto TaxID=9402 RepID=UPI000D53BAA4|nr:gem-associated protein 8 [Pteropus alecto]
MEAKAASSKTTESWASHPVYARYWQHYYQAMAWMRSHQNAYQKAVAAYFSFPWYFPPAAHPQSAYAQEGRSPRASSDQDSASPHCGYSHPPRSGQHPHVGREDQESAEEDEDEDEEEEEEDEEEETESDSDGGVECDLSNMEITEELPARVDSLGVGCVLDVWKGHSLSRPFPGHQCLLFSRLSQINSSSQRAEFVPQHLVCAGRSCLLQHRPFQQALCFPAGLVLCLNPRRQQQLDEARLEDYVNADHDLYYSTRRSVEPPSERPGERRQAEMKRLYGDSAAKIQAMEAAVQLSFDKYCDRKRPKYWPVIPLKF